MTNSYSSPWITRQLAYLKNKKTRLFKRFKISGWQTDFTKYSSAKAEFVQYNFDCYNNDLSRCKRDFKSNPKLFFLSSILNGNLNNNKIFAPPDVFNVLLPESFCLNDDLVIKKFFPIKPRTKN